MSARLITRPLGQWLEPRTVDRRPAQFKASWPDTQNLLAFEAGQLGADLVVIQIDITEADLRRDGMIRANARIDFPGVRVSFESRHGPLTYAIPTSRVTSPVTPSPTSGPVCGRA